MATDPTFADWLAKLRRGDPDAAKLVFDRFARRLIGLAAHRLPAVLRAKVDPEDVVQSAFRSFFAAQATGRFEFDGWDALWAMLTVITVRKCGKRLTHFRAASRDFRREIATAADGTSIVYETPGLDPTPAEAAIWADTLDQILSDLKEAERPVVLMRLQGYAIAEIATHVGRSERTVLRVLEGVRNHLERLTLDDEGEPGE